MRRRDVRVSPSPSSFGGFRFPPDVITLAVRWVGRGAARRAGLVGRRRVLDSTPLYDAVATVDTVTLIRSAIRGLLAVADTARRDRHPPRRAGHHQTARHHTRSSMIKLS